MYICNKKKGIKLKWMLYLYFNIYYNKYMNIGICCFKCFFLMNFFLIRV